MPGHFCPSGAQLEEERPGVPRVHSQVHGGVEQGPLCESQPPDQPWWEITAASATSTHSRLRIYGCWESWLHIVVLELAGLRSVLQILLFYPSGIAGRNSMSCALTSFFQMESQLLQHFFSSLSFPHWFEAPPLWYTEVPCVHKSVSEFFIFCSIDLSILAPDKGLDCFCTFTLLFAFLELAYQVQQKSKFLVKILCFLSLQYKLYRSRSRIGNCRARPELGRVCVPPADLVSFAFMLL